VAKQRQIPVCAEHRYDVGGAVVPRAKPAEQIWLGLDGDSGPHVAGHWYCHLPGSCPEVDDKRLFVEGEVVDKLMDRQLGQVAPMRRVVLTRPAGEVSCHASSITHPWWCRTRSRTRALAVTTGGERVLSNRDCERMRDHALSALGVGNQVSGPVPAVAAQTWTSSIHHRSK
jgi:hypothetical protein